MGAVRAGWPLRILRGPGSAASGYRGPARQAARVDVVANVCATVGFLAVSSHRRNKICGGRTISTSYADLDPFAADALRSFAASESGRSERAFSRASIRIRHRLRLLRAQLSFISVARLQWRRAA